MWDGTTDKHAINWENFREVGPTQVCF